MKRKILSLILVFVLLLSVVLCIASCRGNHKMVIYLADQKSDYQYGTLIECMSASIYLMKGYNFFDLPDAEGWFPTYYGYTFEGLYSEPYGQGIKYVGSDGTVLKDLPHNADDLRLYIYYLPNE